MDNKTRIYGKSTKLQEILRTSRLVAATDVSVLITGESGTGKKLIALDLHQKSRRSRHEMVILKCAGLSDVQNENDANGEILNDALLKAHKGSLFLDDVSALSRGLQQQLLRFIETGAVQPADSKAQKCNVRLIAASKHNLLEKISNSHFDSELFYRLNIIPIELPPLREREGDIDLLTRAFFKEFGRQRQIPQPDLTREAVVKLNQYRWPGNVHELRNFCERIMILSEGRTVDVTNLPIDIKDIRQTVKAAAFRLPANGLKLEAVEVDLIHQALEKSHGNKSRAARLLGLTRDTFNYRLKKYAIEL